MANWLQFLNLQNGIINNWGILKDPEGLFLKPDINLTNMPAGTIFTAPVSGVITAIDTTSSYGDVVTVKMDNPFNSIATHFAFLHLTSVASGIQVGQHVSAGTALGTGGGGISRSGAAVGFSLTDAANYGSGSANMPFNMSYINPLLNPLPFLQDVKSGIFPSSTLFTTPPGSGGSGPFTFGYSPAQLQQFGIVVFAGVIILVGISIVFFNSSAGKKVAQTGAKVATA